MRNWPKTSLFLSGLFFGGGVDHLIYIALGDRTSHYGLTIGPRGHLAFALLDFGIAMAMYLPHSRWSNLEKAL
jgi:hypothetical protein